MGIREGLQEVLIKPARVEGNTTLAFRYGTSVTPDREMLADTLRFMGASVRCVHASRLGRSFVNVVMASGQVEDVLSTLGVPSRAAPRRYRRGAR